MRRRRTLADLATVAIFAVAAVVIWKLRIVDPGTRPYQMPGNGDFFAEIYPMSFRAAEWIRAGRLPLWNPYQFCGHPFLATGIYGVLYPLNFFYLLLSTANAIEATIVLHLAAAGIFMYAFARVVGLSRLAAATAGVSFMWSGFVLSEANWFPPAMSTAPWLPLALLAVERTIAAPRLPWTVVLAAAVALGFLGGWPQTWTYAMAAIGVYAGVRVVVEARHRRHGLGWIVAFLTGGVALGLALAAVQLLPGLELQSLGPRQAGGLSAEQALVFAPLSARWLIDQGFDSLPGIPRTPYIGMAAVLLVVLSVFGGAGRGRIVCFWLLVLFSLGVAVGVSSPLFWLYRSMPGFKWFRGPQRILYLYAVFAAVLSGVGMQVLTSAYGTFAPSRRFVMLAVVTAVALVPVVLVPLTPLSAAYMACSLALIWVAALAPAARVRQIALVALVAVLAGDLFLALRNPFAHPYHDPKVFDGERIVLDYIKAHQGYDRTYIKELYERPPVMSKQGTMRGIYVVTDYEPLSLLRYDRFYRLLDGPKNQRPTWLPFTGRLLTDGSVPTFPLIDLLSVRYIMVHASEREFFQSIAGAATKWRMVRGGYGGRTAYRLFENTDVLPRAYVAHVASHVAGEADALAAVAAPGFDPRTTVVLEGEERSAPVGATGGAITPARIVSYDPTRVIVETDATSPGHLVLTDTFYPGWRATVDDAGVAIRQANYLFRAVPIDAGRHTVVFEYAPLSFRLGAAITLAALACCLAILGRELAVSRRRGGSGDPVVAQGHGAEGHVEG